MSILFFSLLFFLVFYLSRGLTRLLSRLFVRTFRSHTVAVHILSFLFLPGVILHELSHLLFASLLFVQTGEIEFFPEIHGNEVKMGSVAIAKTDPFRRFFIGIAPVVGGLGAMLLLSAFLSGAIFSWQSAILLYAVFEIANTMFSSEKDMEGALGLGIGVLLLVVVLQFLQIPLAQEMVLFLQNQEVNSIFTRLNFFFLIALGTDIFLVMFFEGISRIGNHRH